MTEQEPGKRLPWGPKDPIPGPYMQNIKVGDRMGILHTDYLGDPNGSVVIPPSHYQPPQDTLRFLPEYIDGKLIYSENRTKPPEK